MAKQPIQVTTVGSNKTKGVAATKSRAAISIAWADAPWLDEDSKQQIRDSTPPHLRATVEFGTFAVGEGSIYPIPVEEIVIPIEHTFKIPEHWRFLYGMDVGYNVTATAFLAQNPDTGVWYMYDEYYGRGALPPINAERIKEVAKDWMIGVIDPSSNHRHATDGEQLLAQYKKLGLKLRIADNSVESGITKVWSLLAAGKLKIFANCYNFLNEYILYRREKGKIIKKDDHLLDALRYAIMSEQHARPKGTHQPEVAGIRGPLIQTKRVYGNGRRY